jgi:hypothetical protein
VRDNAGDPHCLPDDLADMFQFTRDVNELFCNGGNVDVARALKPTLQTFTAWVSRNKSRVPLEDA